MERDFLGLRSTKPLAAVKQEITEEDTPCPSMKKASSFPHFSSDESGACHDDRMNHMVSDSSNRGKNSSTTEFQDCPSPVIDYTVNPSFASSGQNVLDAIMRPQFQGAPVMATSAVGQVGSTKPQSNLRPSAAPGQMTIFYAGSVSVYDGITPELAQAIMLLAGNASFLASSLKHPTSPVDKVPSTAVDGVISQPTSNDEAVVIRTAVVSSAAVIKHENVTLGGSIPIPMLATAMLPSAVPQFRKASLARFLKKRKERVMSSAPYSSLETKQGGSIVADNANMVCALPSAGTSAAAV